jgi:hypothetical protein
VAKRTRGSRRDRRRGGRSATVAPPTRTPATPMPAVGELASDAGSLGPSAPPRLPSSAPQASILARSSSRLSTRADEYGYVTLDLRRIAAVMGTLFVVMIGLWVLMDVVHVISI